MPALTPHSSRRGSAPQPAPPHRRRRHARRPRTTSWVRYNPGTGLNAHLSPTLLTWLAALLAPLLAYLGHMVGFY